MPSLLISTNQQCVISINGSFYGIVHQNDEKTLPLPTGETVIIALPVSACFEPLVCLITNESQPHCFCGGILSKWSDEIYCLKIRFAQKAPTPPPFLLKEEKWGDGFAGLCGGCFVFESNSGSRKFINDEIEDFVILSPKFALLKQKDSLFVVDRQLDKKTDSFPCTEHRVEGNTLILSYVPWEMDCFTLEEHFSLEDMSSKACHLTFTKQETIQDTIRCFCQCVRLNKEKEALGFLTPSLKQEFSFQNLKDFLGPFDACESVRFLASPSPSTIALRYKINDNNYHFLCYEFSIDSSSGLPLIDDVSQL